MVLFSLFNLSLRLSYWDCRASMKRGPPPPVLPAVNDSRKFSPDDSPTLADACDMLRDGRLRLEPLRVLAALFAAEVIVDSVVPFSNTLDNLHATVTM